MGNFKLYFLLGWMSFIASFFDDSGVLFIFFLIFMCFSAVFLFLEIKVENLETKYKWDRDELIVDILLLIHKDLKKIIKEKK